MKGTDEIKRKGNLGGAGVAGWTTALFAVVAVLGGTGAHAQVPTDQLALWLKADAGVTQAGGTVTDWADQSGNGRTASQATPALQPVLVAGAVNGLPAIEFDGVDDFVSFNLPVNGLTGMTICMVAANVTNQTSGNPYCRNAALFWDETASWGTVYLTPFQDSVMWRFGTTQTGNWPVYTRSTTLGTSYSISITKKDGATDSLYVNGANVQTEGGKLTAISSCVDTGYVGRGYQNTYFNGRVAELIIYTKALSDAERQQVEQYLTGRYFVSQPPGAPTNLAAVGADSSVRLTWEAASGVVDGYRVYQSDTSGGPYTEVTATTALTYTVTGLTNGTPYYFVVRAFNAAGDGPDSTEVSGTPVEGGSLRARAWRDYR